MTPAGIRGPATYGGADGHTHTARQGIVAVEAACGVQVTGPGGVAVDCPACERKA